MTYIARGNRPTPAGPAFRTPRRISVTLPYAPMKALEERSAFEGRSLSNLAAFLIEQALQQEASTPHQR